MKCNGDVCAFMKTCVNAHTSPLHFIPPHHTRAFDNHNAQTCHGNNTGKCATTQTGTSQHDDDDIDDDGKLFMHDCVNCDFFECDDHRHATMCQFALWYILLYEVFLDCDCRMHVCLHACACAKFVYGVVE